LFIYWADVWAESYKLPSHRQCVAIGGNCKMTKLTSNIKQSFKDTLLFECFYFIIFIFLIGTFSDGSQTTGIFVLIDFFVVVIVAIYYFIFSFIVKLTDKTIGILSTALLLFVLSELSVLTLTGELPVFGLLQKFVYSKKPYSGDKSLNDSIYLFRQSRDLAFSIGGLTSSILFVIIKLVTKNRSHQQAVLHKRG
jgi:hypothetical protein